MESQPQNPEFRINPQNFHPWTVNYPRCIVSTQMKDSLVYKGLPLWQRLFAKTKSMLRVRNLSIFFKIIPCNPSLYTMDHLGLTVSTFMGNSIGVKKG